jgi:thiamine biosynthesis protein ThiS
MPLDPMVVGREEHGALRLTVNGETRAFESVTDLAALVASLGLDSRKVAVERNLQIVPRSAYAETRLADGDRI